MADLVLNGRRFSWMAIEVKFDGLVYTGITALNYKQSLKASKVMGTGIYPMGRTAGEYEAEADAEWLLQDLNDFRKKLAAKAANGSYAFQDFDILAQFDNGVDGVHTVKLVKCRFEEEDSSNSKSADPTTEKVSFSVLWIEKDGLRMVSAADAGR